MLPCRSPLSVLDGGPQESRARWFDGTYAYGSAPGIPRSGKVPGAVKDRPSFAGTTGGLSPPVPRVPYSGVRRLRGGRLGPGWRLPSSPRPSSPRPSSPRPSCAVAQVASAQHASAQEASAHEASLATASAQLAASKTRCAVAPGRRDERVQRRVRVRRVVSPTPQPRHRPRRHRPRGSASLSVAAPPSISAPLTWSGVQLGMAGQDLRRRAARRPGPRTTCPTAHVAGGDDASGALGASVEVAGTGTIM